MARQVSPTRLRQVAAASLPKGIPADCIDDVECDPYDGDGPSGYSYWVYLRNHYICSLTGCHTIHDDTLAEIRESMKHVYYEEDDKDGY